MLARLDPRSRASWRTSSRLVRRGGRAHRRQDSAGCASSIAGDRHASRRTRSFRVKGCPSLLRYPAVLKPVDGAGSVDTFFLDGPGDLPESCAADAQALLQPFVPGEPMSASFLVSPEGRAWPIGVGRQRMEIRDGRFRIPRRRDTGSLSGCRASSPARAGRDRGSRRIRGNRFHLGRAAPACHDSRDQPAPHDVTGRALPALAGGPPGPGLARGISIDGA